MGGLSIAALAAALVAGIVMAVQGSLNSALNKAVGLLEATLIVHVIGVILLIIIFVLGLGRGDIMKYTDAPWYTLLGGALGIIIVFGVIYSITNIGVAAATTAIIVGQVSAALIIDHFGLFGLEKIPFSVMKGVGLSLLAIGAKLMLMR